MSTASFTLSSLALFSLLPTLSLTQDTPSARALAALNALQSWYNPTSGIWDTCGWWNGANCMTVLAGLAKLETSVQQTAVDVFANTYERAPAVNPNPPGFHKLAGSMEQPPQTIYSTSWPHNLDPTTEPPLTTTNKAVDPSIWTDGYYDDDLWWALAWISAWDLTQTPNYLALAIGIFDSTARAWPTSCGAGGIPWNENYTYTNAIANELFLSTAAHLATRVPDAQKPSFADWATRSWTWFRDSGMINPGTGLVNDGLTDDCKNNGQQTWTYNQGVVIGGLVELARAVPASAAEYLDAAEGFANATIAHLTDEKLVLREPCEPDCAPDGTQFKGVFMRNLQMLQGVRPHEEYALMIRASAESVWAKDRDVENKFSVQWAGPFVEPVNASTHSSAMEALVAALVV